MAKLKRLLLFFSKVTKNRGTGTEEIAVRYSKMREYIKELLEEKGYGATPEATLILEYLVTSYTRNLTREALQVSSYRFGNTKTRNNKISDTDLEVILELTSKSIEKRTMTEAMEVI